MLISRFEIIKKHKYTFGIGTASLIAGLFVCMGIRQAPQLAVQQFTTISDSYVYEMQSGDSFDQKVTMPSPWSAIAIRYLPNIRTTKDTKVTLTITQDNQLLPAIQATILDKPNFLDGTDFFSDDLWLLFPLPAFNRDYAGLSLTISVKNGGVVLPYDKEGSHDVHLVGLVKTSFAQRLTFSLANHNRLLLTLQLLIILGAIVLIWHIARIARAKSTA